MSEHPGLSALELSERNLIPIKRDCPCGCGRRMPEPLVDLHMGIAGSAIVKWVEEQGLTMDDIRRDDRHKDLVEARRRIAGYLHEHGWGQERIAKFIGKERTTVRNLLWRKNRIAG